MSKEKLYDLFADDRGRLMGWTATGELRTVRAGYGVVDTVFWGVLLAFGLWIACR